MKLNRSLEDGWITMTGKVDHWSLTIAECRKECYVHKVVVACSTCPSQCALVSILTPEDCDAPASIPESNIIKSTEPMSANMTKDRNIIKCKKMKLT
ncbi:hypothetical protein GOBAR_DD20132 [Gossypium barbadense]|nr:hypothetical protein GOBAR_DD20132 [Gossypium barbadense]